MALLTIHNLALGYDGQTIVRNLDFEVNEGDYLCIVGENGSGKSTLIKTLLHLTRPLGGEIRYGDGLTASEIGYLPQQTVVQRDFPASVREIVLSGCIGRRAQGSPGNPEGQVHQSSRVWHPFYTREEKRTAEEIMEKLGLTGLKNRCYRNLSGGQQQRVLLARALCATRKILLLDEPVAGLDPKVTVEMYQLIQQLNREGVTILMVSHDIAAAMRYASHILHIGNTVFFGTREEYIQSEMGRFFIRQSEMLQDNAAGAENLKEAETERERGIKAC